MSDEEVQREVELGNNPLHPSARVYRKVFDVLRKEPGYLLPGSFADRAVRRIVAAHSSKDIYWFYAGLFSLGVAGLVATILVHARFGVGVFKFISGYPGLVIFGLAFVLFLQWLDRKYIRKSIGL